MRLQQKVGQLTNYKPGKEFSPETNPDITLILGFSSPQLQENQFLFFQPVVFCYGSPNKLIHTLSFFQPSLHIAASDLYKT